MRALMIIAALLATQLFFSCTIKKKQEVIVQDVSYETVVDEVAEEPPPNIREYGKPVTLEKCFSMFSQSQNADSGRRVLRLMVIGINNKIAIGFIDAKKTDGASGTVKNHTGSKPKYYLLSDEDYQHGDIHAVLTTIKTQVKAYSNTAAFKRSPLAKANSITILFDDAESVELK